MSSTHSIEVLRFHIVGRISLPKLRVQAALAIRGLGIRGFDYSRTQKRGKTVILRLN